MKFILAFVFLSSMGGAPDNTLRVYDLRVEHRPPPVTVDVTQPRLSWKLSASGERNKYQSNYQIQVATSQEKLLRNKPDLWDTGKRRSSPAQLIHYEGSPLKSNMICYWRVRSWDEKNNVSDWSAISSWQVGLLAPDDWKAKWIQDVKPLPSEEADLYEDHPVSLFRKEFAVRSNLKRATLHVTGLGYYYASLNGQPISDDYLNPGWTVYDKRIFYNTYDITKALKQGANCAGIELGNGWYNPLPLRMWGHLNLREHLAVGQPCFIFQLHLLYENGSEELVLSDDTWRATDGPVIRNSIYLGEKFDAGRSVPRWNVAGIDQSNWRGVVSARAPGGVLQAQQFPPVKIRETIEPKAIWQLGNGKYMIDMGVNFGGVVELKAKGRRGSAIKLRYGELLYPDSTLNMMTSVAGQIKRRTVYRNQPDTAYQRDVVVLSGGDDTFRPKFTFHGFRYVEVSGYPGMLTSSAVKGLRLSSSVAGVGQFECSNALINQLQQASRNTFLSNLFSVQSDCPHRERFGYGGDIAATSEAMMFNLDMAAFYAKTVQDFADAVRPNNGFTETSPFVGIADSGLGGGSGPIGWGVVHPLLLEQLYQYYGDSLLIKNQYPLAKQWYDLLKQNAKGWILDQCIGDHETLEPKDVALTSTAFFYYTATALSRMGDLLGYRGERDAFRADAQAIRQAFLDKFLKRGTGEFSNGSQANQSFAFYYDLVPREEKANALAQLVDEIEAKRNNHIATGMFGTKYILDVLSRMDRFDLANTMVNQRDFPGWGYMIERGATSIWEHWEYSDNVFSHNHPMWGSISEWFYKHILGIQPQPLARGFHDIRIAPQVASAISWASGEYESARGPIRVDWKREGSRVTLNVSIPANTTAEVVIPSSTPGRITESGKTLAKQNLTNTSVQSGKVAVRVGSGNYVFVFDVL